MCWYKAVNLVGDTLALRLIEEHILLDWPVPIKFSDGHDTIDISPHSQARNEAKLRY